MNSNDSYLLRQERCPKCALSGNDRTGNNLAVYSDGHSYCYGGHGLISGGDSITHFLAKEHNSVPIESILTLPVDSDILFPQKCLDWVGQYGLTKNDLYNHNVMWSESIQRLIFPVYGKDELLAWQGRWFGTGENVKWFGRGDFKKTLNILGTGNTLVLVEAVLSAMVISKCGMMAMPLYGNAIGVERFTRLYKLFGKEVRVLIWLDNDMRTQALLELRRGMLCGLDVGIIYSDKKPKDYTIDEIKEKLNEII